MGNIFVGLKFITESGPAIIIKIDNYSFEVLFIISGLRKIYKMSRMSRKKLYELSDGTVLINNQDCKLLILWNEELKAQSFLENELLEIQKLRKKKICTKERTNNYYNLVDEEMLKLLARLKEYGCPTSHVEHELQINAKISNMQRILMQ